MMPLPLPPAAHSAPSETSPMKLLADVADRLFAENRREEGLCVVEALYLQADTALGGRQAPCDQQDG
ncbi:hypothetical protein [Gluconobacter sp. Gdi]|uniref:hypothetical protein n=1 Tax=Gluconobacter sp. Gdi TaxID=2691888 RepID=UPI00176BD520|nr:hypothetical protein [Gluconobacter sp. Gdi]GFE97816.1 hypothetical protein DmGdi_28890 [Gluconobacter sp. Gdi]